VRIAGLVSALRSALRSRERQYEIRANLDSLRAADRRKNEFLATLGHELRNPLSPLLTSLELLKLQEPGNPAITGSLEVMRRQTDHLIRLVNDLLEVSRITRGRVELRKERTTLQWIIDNAIETSRPSIDEAGHHLEVNVPAEPLALEADPIRLAQVLTNLLNNAAKYTDRNGQILVTARRDGGDAVVTVRDNGRGIAADMLPRIFDLFTQASSGRAHPHGGLGIGLTLVRSLVELHAGTVTAHSAGLLRGSEFTVRLPLQASPADRVEPTPVAREPSLTRRILVVDDNRDAADSLGVVLALHGMEARTAHDGYAALEALDEFRPSVILLDLGLPGIDGYEVAQRVRQHPHGRHATIIALTGWGQERDRRRSADVGMDHHLVKPVDIEALRQLLATLPAEPAAA
jgi:CheY-like chemotaxis protein